MSKWRETYKVHPAADVFPMMSDEELAKLGEDIKANRLKHPICFYNTDISEDHTDSVLIDGRNRLEAMERAGIGDGYIEKHYYRNGDPVAHIIGLNIHRRHLTKQQQADLIVAAIKAAEKLDQVEPVSEMVEFLTPCGMPTGLSFKGTLRELEDHLESRRKGGRGKVNKTRAKAIAEARKLNISEATVKRSIAKADGRLPVPRPNRYPSRPLPKPKSGKPVIGIDAARKFYLDCCTDPDVDLDTEQGLIIDALREIAGKRAKRAQAAE